MNPPCIINKLLKGARSPKDYTLLTLTRRCKSQFDESQPQTWHRVLEDHPLVHRHRRRESEVVGFVGEIHAGLLPEPLQDRSRAAPALALRAGTGQPGGRKERPPGGRQRFVLGLNKKGRVCRSEITAIEEKSPFRVRMQAKMITVTAKRPANTVSAITSRSLALHARKCRMCVDLRKVSCFYPDQRLRRL